MLYHDTLPHTPTIISPQNVMHFVMALLLYVTAVVCTLAFCYALKLPAGREHTYAPLTSYKTLFRPFSRTFVPKNLLTIHKAALTPSLALSLSRSIFSIFQR